MAYKLPTGTVTFLFTDIVGSTPLWEQQPERMGEALQIHNKAIRQAIEAEGGFIFKTVGDAFQAVFPTASQALRTAIAGQIALQSAEWNELGELKVRMGLHTGEAELDPGGDEYIVSHTKNRVARIMAAAYGGQVLLSQETKDLVDHQLPDGVTLKDLGEHRLKGMQWLEHLHQVCAPGLQGDFPALDTSVSHPHNLPLQLTSFIGREQEIEMICSLLSTNRLVTLTGVGGTGKTRLSLRAAEAVLKDFPNGVWFAELAGLADPNLVPRTLISTLDLQESSSQTPLEQLKTYLHKRCMLIVLDNCEHVIADCARITQELLQACPRIKFMASSREALSVPGEVTYPVPSLSVPEPDSLPSLDQLSQYPAVRLFIERARVVNHGFAVTEENARAVVQVCRRLDGIPLAIELAAARMNALSVQQIAERLDNRFRLLTGGSRTAVPRLQTLQASINWSYSLLTEPERLLLIRLSVFQGGWTLGLAEEVCAFDGLDEFDVLDGLASLVSKSLIIAETGTDGDTRYRRLETIRQFAREKLLDSGGSEILHDRHLDAFLKLAKEAEPHLRAHGQVEWLDRLELEMDNLRAAIGWALEGDARKGMHLALSLYWLCHIRGYRSEGHRWLKQLREKFESDSPAAEADPEDLRLLAAVCASQANLQQMMKNLSDSHITLAEEALAMAKNLGEQGAQVQVMALWSLATLPSTNISSVETLGYQYSQKFLEAAEALGDRFWIAESLLCLTVLEPDLAKARKYAERNLALRREMGDLDGIMSATATMINLHFWSGDIDQAYRVGEEVIQLAKKLKNRVFLLVVQSVLGSIYCASGNADTGIVYFQQTLDLANDLGELDWTIWGINALGFSFALKEDKVKAIDYCRQAVLASQKNRLTYWEFASCLNLAEVAYILGEDELAVQFYQAAAAIGFNRDESNFAQLLDYCTGKVALIEGNLPGAYRLFHNWLEKNASQGDLYTIRHALESLAVCALQDGKFDRAVRLHGYISSRSWKINLIQTIMLLSYNLNDLLAPARAADPGEKEYTRSFEVGKAMSIDEAVMYALEEYSE